MCNLAKGTEEEFKIPTYCDEFEMPCLALNRRIIEDDEYFIELMVMKEVDIDSKHLDKTYKNKMIEVFDELHIEADSKT